MRTTVDIDQDVLLATKEIALRENISMGKALSNLARQSLTHASVASMRNLIPLFPRQPDASVVTMEFINLLRDEEG
jgi:hypothetical protein